jgi:hypothetical protein
MAGYRHHDDVMAVLVSFSEIRLKRAIRCDSSA